MIGSNGSMYLTVEFLTEINNIIIIIIGSSNISLRKISFKSYGLDKMYMDKYLMEEKVYQIADQLNEIKNANVRFLFNTS